MATGMLNGIPGPGSLQTETEEDDNDDDPAVVIVTSLSL